MSEKSIKEELDKILKEKNPGLTDEDCKEAIESLRANVSGLFSGSAEE